MHVTDGPVPRVLRRRDSIPGKAGVDPDRRGGGEETMLRASALWMGPGLLSIAVPSTVDGNDGDEAPFEDEIRCTRRICAYDVE